MKKKLTKNGGFTLVELLIVVAIIAILVAISIPMLMEALEKSRHGVDEANYRDAISLANVRYLTNINEFAGTGTKVYVYAVDGVTHQGTLSPNSCANWNDVAGVANKTKAQCTENKTTSGDRISGPYSWKDGYLVVKIEPPAADAPNATPVIKAGWINDQTTYSAFVADQNPYNKY